MAVALVVGDHQHHDATFDALALAIVTAGRSRPETYRAVEVDVELLSGGYVQRREGTGDRSSSEAMTDG